MSNFKKFKGSWNHTQEWDSDDYRSLYIISGTEESPVIRAKDLSDNEDFEITDVTFINDVLKFQSFMPSTKRVGHNKFSLNKSGNIISEFTFTVIEELEKSTPLRVVTNE